MISRAEGLAIMAKRRREKTAAAKALVAALQRGDDGALRAAIRDVSDRFAHREAFRAAARATVVHEASRQRVLQWVVADGDNIRDWLSSDALYLDALRVLLPPYTGPAVRLYRGDSLFNRRRRSYGPSWSSDRSVAESFAKGMWRTFEGGSVLLQTDAPPEAILGSPALLGDEYGEAEYIVDRRRLGRVTVLERFTQATLEEIEADLGAAPV